MSVFLCGCRCDFWNGGGQCQKPIVGLKANKPGNACAKCAQRGARANALLVNGWSGLSS